METAGYASLARQSSLMREMQVIANNIANAQTSGFRRKDIIFSEFVKRVDGDQSLSMATGRVQHTSFMSGPMQDTGGQFDVAIEGDGFFLVEAPGGLRLTRSGTFTPSGDGTLVTLDGHPVLDVGEAPILLPLGRTEVTVAQDGTISSDGLPVGQLAIVDALDKPAMVAEGGTLFDPVGGYEPVDAPVLRQGFVEGSNVDPILEISRMMEVQRAYEMGQNFMQREDERVRAALDAFTR